MFRKPKKIQRRVFCADDDDGDPEPPPPPVISQETLEKKEKKDKKENKPVKSVGLLSFADEGKVFSDSEVVHLVFILTFFFYYLISTAASPPDVERLYAYCLHFLEIKPFFIHLNNYL